MTVTLDAPTSASSPPSPGGRTPAQPRWARPGLWALLAATAALYLWDLSASKWGNDYYAAAAQAGSQSWKAWLFTSLDAGNAITVDKPPAAMWVMGLSMRLFGTNSWALLAPEALMGVASVALLYLTLRRWFGPGAGLLAGAALAVTPVAVTMFRFDNPDALLVLLLTAGAYTTVRAVEKASVRWLAATGALLGFAFLTKMLQGLLVLPAFALVYLIAAPTGPGRRIRHLLVAGLALVVSGGWFVLLVSVWPASSRPYIAGSTNNSLWQLAIGYNGLGRIFGGDGNAAGGAGQTSRFGGSTGIGRLFGDSWGTEISWLLPAALVALVALLALTWQAPRTDRVRAAAVLWGGWLVVSGLTFSYMSGTAHPYYSVALAPAIAALVAVGARVLWLRRADVAGRAGLAAMVAATGVWDWVLLGRFSWAPGLRWIILAAGFVAAAALLIPVRALGRAGLVAAAVAVLAVGAGSAAWGVSSAGVAQTSSSPTAGPAGVASGFGGGGFQGGGPAGGGFREGSPGAQGGTATGGTATGGATTGGATTGGVTAGGVTAGGTDAGGGPGDESRTVDAALVALLQATDTRWAAAANGSMAAAPLQLASGRAVMSIGGFTGSDPAPTLAQFEQYVTAGEIHYYIGGGQGGGARGGNSSQGSGSAIAEWVAAHYSATTVGGTTVYDLTKPTS